MWPEGLHTFVLLVIIGRKLQVHYGRKRRCGKKCWDQGSNSSLGSIEWYQKVSNSIVICDGWISYEFFQEDYDWRNEEVINVCALEYDSSILEILLIQLKEWEQLLDRIDLNKNLVNLLLQELHLFIQIQIGWKVRMRCLSSTTLQ